MQYYGKKICAILLTIFLLVGVLPVTPQAALVDGSQYISQQLYLGDSLMLHLRGNVNYLFAGNAVATVTYCGNTETYRLEDLNITEDGLGELVFDLAAAQLTEEISLTIAVGSVVVLEQTYSIRGYLEAVLAGGFDDATMQLCREVLNFGARAQEYFEYRVEDPADKNYECQPTHSIPSEVPTVQFTGAVPGIAYYGASIRFLSQTAARFYFTAENGVEGYTFTANGQTYTPEQKDGMYYIEVPGINPQDASTPIEVVVSDGSQTVSASYSVTDYLIRSYHKTTDQAYRDLLTAAYSYFMTAAQYDGYAAVEPEATEPETTEPVEQPENLLLGFESYQELTGAKLAVGNRLGRMEINKDQNYISQGTGSLKIMPQGDYSRAGYHPYFKLDLVNTTAGFSDFSNMKSIAFDVYNDQSEELLIGVHLVTGTESTGYLTTNRQSFALAPNSWTTCQYDLSYMAGYHFYDLANVRHMVFEFLDHKQSKEDTCNVLYIDNLCGVAYGTGEGAIDPSYDYHEGITFEENGQEYLFTGQGDMDRDATIEKITYSSAGTVAAPNGGGSYGVRLSHESNFWPTFRLHFGQELPAGTEIAFMAYGRILSGTTLYDQSIFEFSAGGEATEQFKCGQWTQMYLSLPEDCEYIDLFWNYDRAGIISSNVSGEVYIDNIIIAKYEPYGDIVEGYGFEERGNAENFTGQGLDTDATINRIAYENLGLEAPEGSGEYALKLTHSSSMEPTFRLNFGKELAAGTTITFDAYAVRVSGYVLPQKNVINYGNTSTDSFNFKTWKALTVTLPEDAEYIDLTWSFKGTFGSAVSELYLDNIKATEPAIVPTGDFLEGIGFEERGHLGRFTGQGKEQDATIQRVSYANANLAAPTNGGEYALMLSHESYYWPTFRINFGKELAAGTVITFMAYGTIDGESNYNQSIFEYSAGGDATAQFKCDQWTQLTMTLSAAAEYVDLFWNYDRAGITSSTASGTVYLDNFKATEPAPEIEPAGNILEGYSFEVEGNAERFTATGNTTTDATVERVSYADLGIEMPSDGGSYALKLSHNSQEYPTFRIDFGTTLRAGTTINFDAYAITDGSAIVLMNSAWTQAAYLPANAWRNDLTWEITLSEDCDHIDMLWESRSNTNVASAIIIDNIVATEPEASEETGFAQGVSFESTEDLQYFGGVGGSNAWRDATLEIVSFDGDNALKLTCASSYWPTFRISFGETLPAGTVISFSAYSRDITTTDITTVTIFEYVSGGEATAQYYYNSWNDVSFTLASNCSYIDLFCTLDRWEMTAACSNVEVYMDDFKVTLPA